MTQATSFNQFTRRIDILISAQTCPNCFCADVDSLHIQNCKPKGLPIGIHNSDPELIDIANGREICHA